MENDDDGIKTVSCRIPATLRDEIFDLTTTHPERPSYGQLAWWACEDHQHLVEQRTLRHLREKRANRARRSGRGGAGRRATAATVPLTPRLWPEELVAIDRTHASVQQLVTADPDLHTMKVSRTAIVIAAFEIALETQTSRKES